MKDLRYLAHKTLLRSAYSAEADLAFAEQRAPSDVPLRLLKRNVANMGHLLNQCESPIEIACTLLNHLVHRHEELSPLCEQFQHELSLPFLVAQVPLPDLSHPALLRTLQGHANLVTSCAYSPDGHWIVSGSDDTTLKVWDATTGSEHLTWIGHQREVNGCAFSTDGQWIVSVSNDGTIKVWEAQTSRSLVTLRVEGGLYCCSFSDDNRYLITCGARGLYFLRIVQ